MTVEIRMQLASQPIVLNEVHSTYQKGDLFCVRFENGTVFKYPIANIFDIKEFQ